jgi:hypothetical protein
MGPYDGGQAEFPCGRRGASGPLFSVERALVVAAIRARAATSAHSAQKGPARGE